MSGIIITLDRMEKYPWGAYLPEILESGHVNIVRVNTVRWNERQLRGVVEVVRSTASGVKILFDLGQKLRVYLPQGEMTPREGSNLQIFLQPNDGRISLNYELTDYSFPVGQAVIMHDGKLKGEIIESNPLFIILRLTYVHHKTIKVDQLPGIRFPGLRINTCFLGEREKKILKLASELQIEMIATSFVETAQDIEKTRKAFGEKYFPVIVGKVETEQGVDNIEEIIKALLPQPGMIMIARGDLFIDMPRARFGNRQNRIIAECKRHQMPFIVGTGILQSMRWNPEPSRAEVIDADTATRSGAAYLMLSEETARDALFVMEAIRTLHEICRMSCEG